MIHSFNKYTIQMDNYQLRPVSHWIIPYEKSFGPRLETAIKLFQKELNWSEMWDVKEAHERIDNGYGCFVIKPKMHILGWVWISPEHEIKNVYVRPCWRFNWRKTNSNYHFGTQLYYRALNYCFEMEYPEVFFRVDVWNEIANRLAEKILIQSGCRTNLELVEEDY